MKKRIRKLNNGVTLVNLVVTIVILLILAGISIALLFGENGLFEKGRTAKERQEISEYQEGIDLSKAEENIDTNRDKSKIQVLDEVKQILGKEEKFKNAQIISSYENKDDPKLIVKTQEGYIYYVYTDRTEYKGKIGEDITEGDIELEVSLTNEDIKYTYTPSDWTNGEVKVKIEISKEEYKSYGIQYSYDASSWKEYGEELTETENGTKIFTRLTNGLSITKGMATGNVTNIDTQAPKAFTPTATSTTKSITVTASTEDSDATTTSGKVVEGMETVDEIADTETDFNDRPLKPVVIKRIYKE